MSEDTYEGACFCGSVQFSVTGSPEVMGYCHCDSCRSWSASPVNGFSLWNPAAVTITQGDQYVGEFHKTVQSHRKFCTKCGGHLMTDHPETGHVDVYSAMLPDLDFKPEFHVYYGEKVLSIPDGLPKYADVPAKYGGSDQKIAD